MLVQPSEEIYGFVIPGPAKVINNLSKPLQFYRKIRGDIEGVNISDRHVDVLLKGFVS
jgi:hypothetical protein